MNKMDIEHYIQAVREAATAWASAKARLTYLQHYRPALLAKLVLKAEGSSVAAKEKEAYASKEYDDFIDGLAAAVEDEANAHWALKRAEMKVELWRTEQATARLERKGYGA